MNTKKLYRDNARLIRKSNESALLIQQLKSTLDCSICLGLLCIPHSLSCGHSFCFHCLYEWMQENNHCPSCRAALTTAPIPNVILSDQVQIYIQHPSIRTSPQDPNALEKYKTLKDHAWDAFISNEDVYDSEDDVLRCARCQWEMWDGICQNNQCQRATARERN